MKKKMYYNMKMKTVRRRFAESDKNLLAAKQKLLSNPHERLRKLHFLIKEVLYLVHVLVDVHCISRDCVCVSAHMFV